MASRWARSLAQRENVLFSHFSEELHGVKLMIRAVQGILRETSVLDYRVGAAHNDGARGHELRRQVVQAGDDRESHEENAGIFREGNSVIVDDTTDDATQDKVADKVDRRHLGRLLLAGEAQVKNDQDDTDQEFEDRHFETVNIEQGGTLPGI